MGAGNLIHEHRGITPVAQGEEGQKLRRFLTPVDLSGPKGVWRWTIRHEHGWDDGYTREEAQQKFQRDL